MSKLVFSQYVSNCYCYCRILRPNTPYRVLAVENTVLSGGLFYSISNINQSCIGVFQSFLSVKNSHQPGLFKTSRLLLSRMLIYIHQQFVLDENTDAGHVPNLDTMDGVSTILSLVNIAELGNVLHPDTYQDGVDPEERRFLIHVRKQGRHLLRWMSNRYTVEPVLGHSTAIGTSYDIPGLAHSYLLHQADALKVSKMSMEGAGLQAAIPGLTHHALCIQIFGCLGPEIKKLPGCAKTFAWDWESHQVTRHPKPVLSYRPYLSGETPDDQDWIGAGKLLYKLKK